MAEKLVLADLNLNKNEVKQASLEKLTQDPTTNLFIGRMYLNTTTKMQMICVSTEGNGKFVPFESIKADVKSANIRTAAEIAELYDGTLPEGYSFEQFIKDMFRNVLDPVKPSASTLPTMTLQASNGGTVEVDPTGCNDVDITISEASFNEGKIGTMSKTDGESVSVETRQDSGCEQDTSTLKIYNEAGSQQLNTTGENLVVSLHATSEGTESTGRYKGTVDYSASDATAKDSYGTDVTSEFAIPAGTTAMSGLTAVKSLIATYYFLTNTFASKPSSESTVHTMRAILGKKSNEIMFSNPTEAAGDVVFIYPASWTFTVLFKQLDGTYKAVTSDEYEITDGYVVLPTAGSTSAFVAGDPTGITNAVAYKKWTSKGNIGAREYKITLS